MVIYNSIFPSYIYIYIFIARPFAWLQTVNKMGKYNTEKRTNITPVSVYDVTNLKLKFYSTKSNLKISNFFFHLKKKKRI